MSDFKFIHYVIAIAIFLAIEIFVLLSLSGCTTIRYVPETGEVHYSAPPWGKQFEKLEIERIDNDLVIEISNYKTENISDIAGSVAEGVAKGLK